ncbi:hypothetical protein IL306_006045 [Fusarium sp. DS 682]|nr:hypothetical protein IL306_006045 [Fusarium sp. DS 682]
MALQVRSERLRPGKSFLDFSEKTQLRILEYAIPPLVVPCDAKNKNQDTVISEGERSLEPLKLSCRKVYNIIKNMRNVEAFELPIRRPLGCVFQHDSWDVIQGPAISSPLRMAFSFDPSVDILRVWNMKLPNVENSQRVSGTAHLPVQRLISMWIDQRSRSILPGDGAKRSTDSIEYWVYKSQSFDERFRQAGDPPTNGIPPGQHIGEPWSNGVMNPPPGPEEYRCPVQGLETFEPLEKPLIGMYGYDIDKKVRGGFWAGFRYYTATREVWFTPLSWYEVYDAMVVPIVDMRQAKLFGDTQSDFVARVSIIGPDHETPANETHHRWTRVKNAVHRDPHYTKYIEATWEIVVERFNKQTQGETPYTLRI